MSKSTSVPHPQGRCMGAKPHHRTRARWLISGALLLTGVAIPGGSARGQASCSAGTSVLDLPGGPDISISSNQCGYADTAYPPGFDNEIVADIEDGEHSILDPFQAGALVSVGQVQADLLPLPSAPWPPPPPDVSQSLPPSHVFLSPQFAEGLASGISEQVLESTLGGATPGFRSLAPTAAPPLNLVGRETDPGFDGERPLYEATEIGGQGLDTQQINADDPVLPGTGEFVYTKVDIDLPGIGIAFRLLRTYRSRWSYEGPIGSGWTHSFDQRLFEEVSGCGESTVNWSTGLGSVVRFRQGTDGHYRTESSTPFVLVERLGKREVVSPDGIRRVFGTDGFLEAIIDLNGNQLVFTWQSGFQDMVLTRVTDTLNRQFTFAYRGAYLDNISEPSLGTLVRFTVDSEGDLVTVTDRAGVVETYQYDTDLARTWSLPSQGLEEACFAACGGASEQCGGECADLARQAEQDCIWQCEGADCAVPCIGQMSEACEPLVLANTNECVEVCQNGCTADPQVCRGFEPRPTTMTMAACLMQVRADGTPMTECGARPDLAARRNPTIRLDGNTEHPEGCCISAFMASEWRTRHQDCLAGPPAGPNSVCLDGYNARVDICGQTDDDCDAFAEAQRDACDDQCDDVGEAACESGCHDYRICARYASEIPVISIRSWDCSQASPGYAAVCELLGAAINVVEWVGSIFSATFYWTGEAAAGDGCLPFEPIFPFGDNDGWMTNEWPCVDRCTSTCEDHCVSKIAWDCKQEARTGCSESCVNGCPAMIGSSCRQAGLASCTEACSAERRHDRCAASCGAIAWQEQCVESCADKCVACHHPCSTPAECAAGSMSARACSEVRFGAPSDLNHNLTRVIDGNGRVVVFNEYQTNIGDPAYDKVRRQEFGGEATTYEYFDLGLGAPSNLPGEVAALFQTESYDLCPSACEESVAMPSASGGELWVRMVGGGYLVFPDALANKAAEGVFGPGTQGWGVDFDDRSPRGINAYGWYEIRATAGEARVSGTIEPPTALPIALKIRTAYGSVILSQSGEQYDRVTMDGESKEAIEALFGRAGIGGTFSILRGQNGWLGVPGRAGLAASVSHDRACADFFRVAAEQPGGPLEMIPPTACSGPVTFEEIGRRGDQRVNPSTGLSPGGWDSLLTDPRVAITWDFGDVDASIEPTALIWRGDRFGAGGRGVFPGAELCGQVVPSDFPDPSCLDALAFVPAPFPQPDCGLPHLFRGARGGLPWPAGTDTSIGCSVGPGENGPLLPNACLSGQDGFRPPVAFPATSRAAPQRLERLTVVTDSAGARWAHYSSKHGVIQRVQNVETGSRMDLQYDRSGRLMGTRNAFGVRSCYEYDADRNVVRVAEVAAPDRPATYSMVDHHFDYGKYGRLTKVYPIDGYDTELDELLVWNSDWNLSSAQVHTGAGNLLTQVTGWDRGRPTALIRPNGRQDRVSYSASSGVVSGLILGFGNALRQDITLTPNAEGLPVLIKRPGHPKVEFAYTNGRPTSVSTTLTTGSTPFTQSILYDAAGQRDRLTGVGPTIRYRYTDRGELETVRAEISAPAEVQATCYRYLAGRLTSVVDPEGRWTFFSHNAHGDVTSLAMGVPVSGEASPHPDCAANLTDPVQPKLEVVKEFIRDDSKGGLLLAEISAPGTPDETTVSYTYDGYGRVIEVEDADGSLHRVDYDRYGRVAWKATMRPGSPRIPASGIVEPTLQDPGLVSWVRYAYDRVGRPTEERSAWFIDEPAGRRLLGAGGWRVRTTVYDDTRSEVRSTDAEGRTTVQRLDLFGRPVLETLPDGVTTVSRTFSADLKQVQEVVQPSVNDGGVARRTVLFTDFGALSRVRSIDNLDLQAIDYDNYGRPMEERTLTEGRRITYDAFWRLSRIHRRDAANAWGQEYLFGYNRRNESNALTTPTGTDRREFDQLNRVAREKYADGSTLEVTYLPGTTLPSQQRDRSQGVFNHTYLNGRLTQTIAQRSVGGNVRRTKLDFAHGILGLESMTSSQDVAGMPGQYEDVVTRAFTLDSLGRVAGESNSAFPGQDLSYVRSAEGRLATLASPGRSFTLAYDDPLGRLTGVDLGANRKVTYEYQGSGPPRRQRFGNGVSEELLYEDDGSLYRRSTNLNTTSVARVDLSWSTYRALARVDERFGASAPRSDVFETDRAGRLKAASSRVTGLAAPAPGATGVALATVTSWITASPAANKEAFAYRVDSSISSVTRAGVATSPTIGTDGRYLQFGGSVASDTDGRVTSLPDGTTFQYDGAGRVRRASKGGVDYKFLYDAAGTLVGYDKGTETYRFQDAEGLYVAEQSPAGTRTLIPGFLDGPVGYDNAGTTTYLHYDFGSRLAFATSGTGAVVEDFAYDGYGRPRFFSPSGVQQTTSITNSRLLFGAQPSVPELGIHRLGARWYRPEMGAFLSADPLGLMDGPNRYVYGGANPAIYSDFSGLAKVAGDASGQGPFLAGRALLDRMGAVGPSEELPSMADTVAIGLSLAAFDLVTTLHGIASEDGAERTHEARELTRQALRNLFRTPTLPRSTETEDVAALAIGLMSGLLGGEGKVAADIPRQGSTRLPQLFRGGAVAGSSNWTRGSAAVSTEGGSVLRQLTPNSCGQTCGAMLLRDRGIDASRSMVATRVGSAGTTEGPDVARAMSEFLAGWRGGIVDHSAFSALISRGSWAAMLGRGKIGHWVVVDGVDGASVLIRDPASGVRTMTIEAFLEAWNGSVVFR